MTNKADALNALFADDTEEKEIHVIRDVRDMMTGAVSTASRGMKALDQVMRTAEMNAANYAASEAIKCNKNLNKTLNNAGLMTPEMEEFLQVRMFKHLRDILK